MKTESNKQIAWRIAIEAVTRYLPDESPDVGRGRRCLEFLESQIEAALDARDERAVKIADQWANSHSCDAHDDNPCCHVRTGATIRDLILGVKP